MQVADKQPRDKRADARPERDAQRTERNNDRSAEQHADEDPERQRDDIGRIADYNSVADLSGNSGDDVLGPCQSQDVAALDHRTRRDGNILTAAHNAAEENTAQRKIRLRYFA